MKSLGLEVILETIPGGAHEPQVDEDMGYTPVYDFILTKKTEFLYNCLNKNIYTIIGPDNISPSAEAGFYFVRNALDYYVAWQCEGGIITKAARNSAEVVWLKNSPKKSLEVALIDKSGILHRSKKIIN